MFNKQEWRALNHMPAAFRKRTTEAHLMSYKKIMASTEKERMVTHRSLTEAIKLAEKITEYIFLDNIDNEQYTYCSLEGRYYMNRIQARQMFVTLCRQINPIYAGDIITLWYDEQWLTLKHVVAKLAKDKV